MASEGKHVAERAEQHARSGVRRASPFQVALGRFGYAAEGLVYLLIGVIAVQVALGRGGETTDNKGVLVQIAGAPFGRVLLIAIAIGFVGYAVWRFCEAALDPERKGSDAKGIAKRLGFAITGVLHLAFAVSVVRLLQTGSAGANTDTTAKGGTAELLSKPFGQWLVGLVGLGVLGFAGWQFYQAIKAKFRENADLAAMNKTEEELYTTLGRIGYAARGVVFVVIGLFLIVAARNANPQDAHGLDSALADLATRPFGPWLLGLTALGFVAYGLFLFAEARFHAVEVS
jgi:hypothetical protein